MRLRTRSMAGRAIAAAATLTLVVTPLALTGGGAQADTKVPALRVMTRNLYLGADITRPITAILGETDPFVTITKLANATYVTRDIVDDTDFGVRSKLLAKEIAAVKPDLVGLQEVALWRSGDLQLAMDQVAVPNATTVDYDWLKMLRRQLRAAGVPYRPVSVNWLSDVEAPAFSGTLAAPGAGARDVRLTMRDVILKRVGSGIEVLRHRERSYTTNFEIPPLAGKELDFTRGYQWVDVKREGKRFRFLNTHLEAFSSDIAFAQMKQMIEGPGSYDGTTIIACDCNSDPLNQTVKTAIGDTRPHSDPYWLATGRHEYFDTWLQWRPARKGWTSGLNETVDEATPSFTHRIDLILARRGDGGPLRVVGGQVTGDELEDRDTTSGLWPSDHAGVMMKLRGL